MQILITRDYRRKSVEIKMVGFISVQSDCNQTSIIWNVKGFPMPYELKKNHMDLGDTLSFIDDWINKSPFTSEIPDFQKREEHRSWRQIVNSNFGRSTTSDENPFSVWLFRK